MWFAGLFVSTARLGRGLLLSWRIRRNAFPFPEEILHPFAQRLSSLLGRPTPRIFVSDQISVPAAIGCFPSIVLVPPALLARLDDKQLLAVLVHECAHAIRRDPLAALYQRLLAAFLWFHPLAHLANVLLDRAREDVCDNYALHIFRGGLFADAACCRRMGSFRGQEFSSSFLFGLETPTTQPRSPTT